jgi:CRP/FNR family transcriptional regulator, cyclic AMP receptor protein
LHVELFSSPRSSPVRARSRVMGGEARPSVLLYEAHPYLTGVPDIFAALTPPEQAQIAAAGREFEFAPGEHLFRQGEPHDGIFVLRAGEVRSYYVAPNGREITLAAWPSGNFVGGPEIFGGGVHVWSGVALSAGRALHLPGGAIPGLMREVPNFAIGLVHGLSFKGKCYSALLQMLGTRSVVERLALVLLNLAVPDVQGTLILPRIVPHEELAALVGGTRQWVSMTIERFRKRGLVELRERRLVILSPASLRQLAGGGRS